MRSLRRRLGVLSALIALLAQAAGEVRLVCMTLRLAVLGLAAAHLRLRPRLKIDHRS
jgi:hypothetical protein